MCRFLNVGLPARGATALAAACARGGLVVRDCANASVKDAFPPTDQVFEVTIGGCSCDLYAPWLPLQQDDKERSKYGRKGWSEAKIARALASRHVARIGSAKRESKLGARRLLREAIMDALEQHARVRLFAHTYGGPVDQEPVSV